MDDKAPEEPKVLVPCPSCGHEQDLTWFMNQHNYTKADLGLGLADCWPWVRSSEPDVEEARRRYWVTGSYSDQERQKILSWWTPPDVTFTTE